MDQVIAACGIVCSECEAYIATLANDVDAIARIADEWSQTYGADIRPEDVWCEGCMTAGERKCNHTGDCGIRACVQSRSLNNCAECADYGCAQLTQFFQMVPAAQATLDALRTARV